MQPSVRSVRTETPSVVFAVVDRETRMPGRMVKGKNWSQPTWANVGTYQAHVVNLCTVIFDGVESLVIEWLQFVGRQFSVQGRYPRTEHEFLPVSRKGCDAPVRDVERIVLNNSDGLLRHECRVTDSCHDFGLWRVVSSSQS